MTDDESTRTYPNGWTISLETDEYPSNPRDWDHIGIMACGHRRYDLGDEKAPEEASSWGEVARLLKAEEGARCLLPLYLFDHSGLSMTTNAASFQRWDSAGWDWGQVGFIYTTTERLTVMGCERWKAPRIRDALRAEVAQYDAYLRGDVVAFVVKDADGNVQDSCSGFYPDGGPDPFAYVWAEAEANLPDMAGVMLAGAGIGL